MRGTTESTDETDRPRRASSQGSVQLRALRGARGRDDGALLVLAGFILGIAILAVVGGVSLVVTNQHALTQSGATDTVLDQYLALRERVVRFAASQPTGVEPRVFEQRFRDYLNAGFEGSAPRSVDVNVTLADTGTVPRDELSFKTTTGCGLKATCYDAWSVDGTVDFHVYEYDGTDDGLIRSGTTTVGALVRIEIVGPTQSLAEIVVISFV